MRGATYWPKEIKQKDRVSPKTGAIRRLDRLRSVLRDLDPVVANRAWREIGDALQGVLDRYSQ
ncbi:hypothetical protein ACWCOW_35215 [Streptomyces sp. NPDC001939]